MATNIGSLSAAKLKELKSGEKITIRHAQTQEQQEKGASRIIFEQFSRGAATAFSTKWASTFPPINKMTITDMQKPKQTSTTIIGGHVPAIQKILVWILSCCDGSGVKPYPIFQVRPFSTYFDIKEAADLIGVSIISKEMQRRMNEILSQQIHSDDVREMYARLPCGHPVIKTIVSDIANRTWKRELVAAGAYRALRKELPRFDQDINVLLDSKREELRLDRVKEMEAQKAERASKTRGKSKAGTGAGGKKSNSQLQGAESKMPSSSAVQPRIQSHSRAPAQAQPKQTKSNPLTIIINNNTDALQSNIKSQFREQTPQTQPSTTKLRCPVARKAQRGRPAYVSLSLADVGISKEDFTGASLQQGRSARSVIQQAGENTIVGERKEMREAKMNRGGGNGKVEQLKPQSHSFSQDEQRDRIGSASSAIGNSTGSREGTFTNDTTDTTTTATPTSTSFTDRPSSPSSSSSAITVATTIPTNKAIAPTTRASQPASSATAAAVTGSYPTVRPLSLTYANACAHHHFPKTSAVPMSNNSLRDNRVINGGYDHGLNIDESRNLNVGTGVDMDLDVYLSLDPPRRPHNIVVSFPKTGDWIVV